MAGSPPHNDWENPLSRGPVAPYNRPVPPLAYILTALGSYLLGSIPTGFLVGRAKGIDIRVVGSGNIGATNAFRILGRRAGIFVLLVDALKGAAAVLLLPRLTAGQTTVPLEIIAALCVVLGHNFTCWLRFRGGKGISTSAGVLGALVPLGFLITLAAFLTTLAVSRYVSLASVVGAVVLPFAVAFTPPGDLRLVILTGLMALLAIGRHRTNLQRLWAGTERRLGSGKPEAGG